MKALPRITSLKELNTHIQAHSPCIYILPQNKYIHLAQRCSKEKGRKESEKTKVTVSSSPSKCYINPSVSFWILVKSLLSTWMTLAEFLKVGLDQGCVISGTDTCLYHKQKPTPL